MSIQRCPVEHCGGNLWNEGDRIVCSFAGHVVKDDTTFREHFAASVPTVLAYREMTATGSHSRLPITEAQTDGLMVERVR